MWVVSQYGGTVCVGYRCGGPQHTKNYPIIQADRHTHRKRYTEHHNKTMCESEENILCITIFIKSLHDILCKTFNFNRYFQKLLLFVSIQIFIY